MRDVFIIGVDTIKFGKYLDKSIKDLACQTVTGCLKDANITKKEIQSIWFSNSNWCNMSGQTGIRGQVALRPMGIDVIPMTNVENACAGASTALHHAWLEVASGEYDMTMALGVEKLYDSNSSAVFAGFLGYIDIENCVKIAGSMPNFGLSEDDLKQLDEFKKKYQCNGNGSSSKRKKKKTIKSRIKDLKDSIVTGINLGEKIGYKTVYKLLAISSGDHSPFMDIYSFAARQHMKKYGSTIEQLATIASKNHFNSSLNPNAQYQFLVPVDKVLSDRIISFPLTRSMCAPIGDGAASALVCSEKKVKELGLMNQAVKIKASILGSGSKRPFESDEPEIGQRLAKKAYERAGVSPEDIGLAEVHDATAYGEICQVENLGFCPKGEGGILAEKGATQLDGSIPINTSGGLISRGHPIGASGLAQIHELVTQLRGHAGKRQVKNPRLAMGENGGGALGAEEAAMCIHILEAPCV